MGFLQSHPMGVPWETAESCTGEPHPHGNTCVLPEEPAGLPPSLSSRSILSYKYALGCCRNREQNLQPLCTRLVGFLLGYFERRRGNDPKLFRLDTRRDFFTERLCQHSEELSREVSEEWLHVALRALGCDNAVFGQSEVGLDDPGALFQL